ncbi:MAG: hybrid sensor histidine kinase/response regulator [Spirochaetaceae bacterium]|nr:MAG: hybrid sensor histidine kinase/response regulator [Spirochaetaceae bacterium]
MNDPAQRKRTLSAIGPMSVLVVDDEEGMREGIRRVLDRNGYCVTTAEDGEHAIALLGQCAFDIALVDLKMPNLDGFQVTQHISDVCGGRTVTVIVSAFATVQAAVEAAENGAFDFLVKPFAPDDLLRVVTRAACQRQLIRERDLYLSELESEQNLLRQLINSMSDGVVLLNDKGKPVVMNPRAESMLGVSFRDGMDIEDLRLERTALTVIDGVRRSGAQSGTPDRGFFERAGQRFELRAMPLMKGVDPAGIILSLRSV